MSESLEVTTDIADVMKIGKPEKGRWYRVEYTRSDAKVDILFVQASSADGAHSKAVKWMAALVFTEEPTALTEKHVWAEFQKVAKRGEE